MHTNIPFTLPVACLPLALYPTIQVLWNRVRVFNVKESTQYLSPFLYWQDISSEPEENENGLYFQICLFYICCPQRNHPFSISFPNKWNAFTIIICLNKHGDGLPRSWSLCVVWLRQHTKYCFLMKFYTLQNLITSNRKGQVPETLHA